ncbi:DUF5927 domain-containing protein [Oceanomicrobium pacificus]|uniref:Peptide O-xylosyltransferase n=1 Tax=Oceanomicrobium pacificus TaxID=2692916 RepID=A0A6B0TJR7_9RHOB|nr:beta-1,6-N-acetylglucosaminyltransferase [Oceanomicrobium pacificus]MXU64687.1 glycosyl transferase [Oceanomicrobium pacificus]
MQIGIVILAHERLDRAADLARALAAQGAAVALHVDAATPSRDFAAMQDRVAGSNTVHLVPRRRCDWGQFSIVQATLDSVAHLFERAPDVTHVCLISGACLPLRRLSALEAHLAAHPDTDFIESYAARDGNWVLSGLGEERFTLRFPFSWRRQRWLFDRSVDVQRKLGITRRVPDGLDPHLGSQWWCLTRPTLDAILSDPQKPRFDRFFRQCWIPDEGYFQTLARRHARRIAGQNLTFSRFDAEGRPHVLYDDHEEALARSGAFFARKVWPDATRLYARFLAPPAANVSDPEPDAAVRHAFVSALQASARRRCEGRDGLVMMGRCPAGASPHSKRLAGPVAAFLGHGVLFEGFDGWLEAHSGTEAHGRIFRPRDVELSHGRPRDAGVLRASAAQRDIDPQAYLRALVWNGRDRHQSLQLAASDLTEGRLFLAYLPDLDLHALHGAWLLDMLQLPRLPDDVLASQARTAQRREKRFLSLCADLTQQRQRRPRIQPLADAIAAPYDCLAPLPAAIQRSGAFQPILMPELADMSGLPDLLDRLHRLGIDTRDAGDCRAAVALRQRTPQPAARWLAVAGG